MNKKIKKQLRNYMKKKTNYMKTIRNNKNCKNKYFIIINFFIFLLNYFYNFIILDKNYNN